MDASSSDDGLSPTFDAYADELKSLLRQVLEENALSLTEKEGRMGEASSLVQQMAVEARCLDPPHRAMALKHVQQAKRDWEQVKQRLNQSMLYSKPASAVDSSSSSFNRNKESLERVEDQVARQNEMLARAHRSILETEETGSATLSELHRNRSTLESTQSRVSELQSLTSRADAIITNMMKPWWLRR